MHELPDSIIVISLNTCVLVRIKVPDLGTYDFGRDLIKQPPSIMALLRNGVCYTSILYCKLTNHKCQLIESRNASFPFDRDVI